MDGAEGRRCKGGRVESGGEEVGGFGRRRCSRVAASSCSATQTSASPRAPRPLGDGHAVYQAAYSGGTQLSDRAGHKSTLRV
ncbi:unnamed protein product [Chondrus crispus]|uniref:Uncharacterized protein n=1 Tax=Chondrus crispus TaxID=2769 RepID=R7QB47_CHOCR|nr:unnamed protein product [Chondrus crispus]CDF35742.1 unnamed protein product [Chondrus crispus]|eukprot:XP_005715561.1 unnamed protein product [Chondrus crispus]